MNATRAAGVRAGSRVPMAVSKDRPGRLLMRLSTLPAVAIGGFLVLGSVLVHADAFSPWLALPLGVLVAAALCWWVRRVPRLVRAPRGFTPWWVPCSALAIAVVFGVVQGLLHTEAVAGGRDPAAYLQYGWWLAHHGGLPIDQHPGAFGGDTPGVSWGTDGFVLADGGIWPRLMAGLPILLSAAAWIGGVPGMLLTNSVVGALAVLAFAGLTARLVGPRWVPLAALVLAGSFPLMLTARSAGSEPLAQLLLLGGLCLLVDCRELRGRAARAAAGTAGLLLGMGGLIQVPAVRILVPLVVVVGVLAAKRRVQAPALAVGLLFGVALSVADGLLLARLDLSVLRGWLLPLGVLVAAAVLLTGCYALLVRHGRLAFTLPEQLARVSIAKVSLPRVCGGVVGLVFVALAVRPWWQTVRGADGSAAQFVAGQQRRLDLPVDPSRLYTEWSLHWTAWWVGWAVIVLAVVAAVFLTARVVAGKGGMRWLPVLPILLWGVVVTLWLPSTMPDHPWADRRLVPLVLPAIVLLGTWGLSWMVRTYRPQAPRWVTGAVAVIGVLAFLAPVAVASAPLVAAQTRQGSVAALRQVCSAIGPKSSVVVVGRAASRYVQPVRGFCGAPTAAVFSDDSELVRSVVDSIESAGRQPVLLGASKRAVAAVSDTTVRQAVDVRTRQDAHTLVQRPDTTLPARFTVWLAFP